MKQHFTWALKLLGERFFFNFLAFCMIPVFIAIIDSLSFGSVLFSLVILSLYLGIAYDMIWKLGKHDRQPYAAETSYPFKGFVVALISEAPFALLCLFLFLFPTNRTLFFIYRSLCITPYMGLLPQDRLTVGYALVLLIMPVVSCIAYYFGHRTPRGEEQPTLSEKLLYKKK